MLTVEDVNSINSCPVNELYVLDTSKIGTDEFENVLYDFCIVSHTKSNNKHIFTFEVKNKLWCGGVRARWKSGNVSGGIPLSDMSYANNVITITTSRNPITIYLYLCSFAPFNFSSILYVPMGNFYLVTKDEIGTSKQIMFTDDNYVRSPKQVNVIEGVQYYDVANYRSYILFLIKKTDIVYDLSDTTVTVGSVNKVRLNVDTDYLPAGDLVDDDADARLDIKIKYNDEVINAEYDSSMGTDGDYVFDLDLTDKMDDKNIQLDVIVNESTYVTRNVSTHSIRCRYAGADSYSALQSAIVSGARIIELTDDITFEGDLTLSAPLYLIGDNHSVNVSNNSIIVESNVKFEDIIFSNGSPVFVQGNGSKLVVENCQFSNAKISDAYKGSVLSTLTGDDIVSELIGCSILNCHHSIYHGGELTIDNVKALYNDYTGSIDTDYSSFLTMYDGSCEITNSTFDIDYDTDAWCNDERDIKFAESLIGLGEDTIFNGYSTNQLNANNSLHLCDSPFNNRSHIYVKYYYPGIEACVISSPVLDMEDKSCCHTILGQDWVFKNNVQITRADSNTQNNVRKITWEMI